MNAVSVNVSAYCDLEKFSSDKFDPLIMNRIRVKSWELVTILPSPSSLVRYRPQILIDHSGTNNTHFISSYCTAHYFTLHTPYCKHNAGRRGKLLLFMFSIRSHNMLCCVTLSRVIALYKQYHTSWPSQTKTQRQLPVMMRGWWKSSKHVTSWMCFVNILKTIVWPGASTMLNQQYDICFLKLVF